MENQSRPYAQLALAYKWLQLQVCYQMEIHGAGELHYDCFKYTFWVMVSRLWIIIPIPKHFNI